MPLGGSKSESRSDEQDPCTLSERCSICGSAGISGYTVVDDKRESRCFSHYLRDTDGPLVHQAVEQLGLGISYRQKVNP